MRPLFMPTTRQLQPNRDSQPSRSAGEGTVHGTCHTVPSPAERGRDKEGAVPHTYAGLESAARFTHP